MKRIIAFCMLMICVSSKADIITIGDSYACVWPQFIPISESNRLGVGGSTADQWIRGRGQWLSTAVKHESDTVIVSLMINDVLVALKDDNRMTYAESIRIYHSYRAVIRKLIGAKKTVYLVMYPTPLDSMGQYPAWLPEYVNDRIQDITSDLDVQYIWLSRVLTEEEHFVSRTDFHPSLLGYKRIAAYVRRVTQ